MYEEGIKIAAENQSVIASFARRNIFGFNDNIHQWSPLRKKLILDFSSCYFYARILKINQKRASIDRWLICLRIRSKSFCANFASGCVRGWMSEKSIRVRKEKSFSREETDELSRMYKWTSCYLFDRNVNKNKLIKRDWEQRGSG